MRIVIKTTGDAFINHKASECARIIRDLANSLDNAEILYPNRGQVIDLYDSNGNKVGTCRSGW